MTKENFPLFVYSNPPSSFTAGRKVLLFKTKGAFISQKCERKGVRLLSGILRRQSSHSRQSV
jgi:hypothetical protein